MSDAKNLHQRLAAAMGAVTYIQREKKKGMQYSIVSHDAVTALVRPALLENGVIYYPVKTTPSYDGNRTEAHMVVRFANIDEPSDYIDVETFGHGIDPGDKSPGKAMSYAVKYALLKTLGLESGDDPDLDQTMKHETRKPSADIDASAREYVSRALAKIEAIKGVQPLKAWWANEDFVRRELGIVNGTPTYAELFTAYRGRGTAISAASKNEGAA